ncbi:reticuline oxidase [Ceratobasidium sp. AG-Ba]|nr:reticuline oxidase [Ceratobasidium sp. AG-Ba]
MDIINQFDLTRGSMDGLHYVTTLGFQGRLRRRNKLGNLANINLVPLDIFTEITSYLNPLDILNLSRTTKYFRTLLMRSSAVHIWHAAERNIPGLPKCPAHMSEPAYAALVFVRACTYCGTTANVPKSPNPELYVRLCGACVDSNVMNFQLVPTIVQPYVMTSSHIKSHAAHNDTFCLRDDVNFVTNKLLELMSLNDSTAGDRWKVEMRKELDTRRTHSEQLRQYLVTVETIREDDLESMKKHRLLAIRNRLTQEGWEETDIDHIHPTVERRWRQLVWQAKPLTDRIWGNLYPKLLPILQVTKDKRLVREAEENRASNHARVQTFLDNIKEHERPFVELATESNKTIGTTYQRVLLPFPSIESIKQLSFLTELRDWIEFRKPPIEDTETNLESCRSRLKDALLRWQIALEEEMVGKLSEDDFDCGPIMPSQQRLLAQECDWMVERVVVPVTKKFTPESLQYVRENTAKLLRADSIFGVPGNGSGYFYPQVLEVLEQHLTQSCHSIYKRRPTYHSDYDYEQEAQKIQELDTTSIYLDCSAQNIAGELLDLLGQPNASYLEMNAVGQRFTCARCWNKKPMTWIEIVRHFENAYDAHRIRTSFYLSKRLSFTSVNLHDLGDRKGDWAGTPTSVNEPDPVRGEIIQRIAVKIAPPEDADKLLLVHPPAQLFSCGLCELVKGEFIGKLKELPRGSKEEIEQHLAEE